MTALLFYCSKGSKKPLNFIFTLTYHIPSFTILAINGLMISKGGNYMSVETKDIRNIAIIGHTDKVGTYEANMKVSKNRAYAVENYLQDCGVSPAQFKKVEGVGYNEYDESLSADQNRRVEVYMYASEQMIKNAEASN